MPGACKWDGRICETCGKKRSEHEQTARLRELAMAMRGGMPMERDELSLIQWQALGLIRAQMEPRL